MAFLFHDLNGETRNLMREEFGSDQQRSVVYVSPRLNERGRTDWAQLLLEAMDRGTEATLAGSIRAGGKLIAKEPQRRQTGTIYVTVRRDPPEVLAEGEFNRFYIRAVCRRALATGEAQVLAYRAKPVKVPRETSVALEGTLIDARQLLDDLQTHIGEDPALHLPGGPNSGISVRLQPIRP